MNFEDMFQGYLNWFNRDGEVFLKTICNCDVPIKIILGKYRELPPIEDLEEKERADLISYARETFPEKTDEEKLIIAKAVYTIGTFLN